MATPGTWLQSTYQGMPYFVLRPDGYDAAVRYPALLHLHQYQNHSGQPGQADPWYNTASFRSAHPCFVIIPLCMIGSQTSTPTFNWGGVTPELQQPIVSALAILDLVVAQYNCDRSRQYVTGNSMGGLGTWGILCNPAQRDRFAGAMPVSGSCYYNVGNEAAIAAALKDIPIWSCHGAKDTQVLPVFDQAMFRAMQAIGGAMRFTGDPNGSHDTWDSFYPSSAPWDWLFAQRKGGTAMPASADRTTVIAPSASTIIDASGNAWGITASSQVAVNGVADTATSNVVELAWVNGLLWQCNTASKWYFKASPTSPWSSGTSVNPLAPQAAFTIQAGKIIDPDGNAWVAAGINNRPTSRTNASAILSMFPGINFVRLAMGGLEDPVNWNEFISTMEIAKIVCLKEFHPWPLQPAQTGTDLAAQAATAGRWASYFKGRPYVWIGSMNEPQSGNMTPEHQAVYNAVRAADATKVVVFQAGIGGGNPGQTGARVLNPAAYAPMTRIVWDLHYYGWTTKYSTDQATCGAMLRGAVSSGSGIAAAKAITSADGVVPVIVGEFGPSTSGSSTDANAPQVIKAVLDAVAAGQAEGYAGWSWAADPFNALQSGGQPTAWGKQLAAAITATTGKQPPPPPPPPSLSDLAKQLNAASVVLSSVANALAKMATT